MIGRDRGRCFLFCHESRWGLAAFAANAQRGTVLQNHETIPASRGRAAISLPAHTHLFFEQGRERGREHEDWETAGKRQCVRELSCLVRAVRRIPPFSILGRSRDGKLNGAYEEVTAYRQK
jgi:hypothetical protein